MDYTCGCILHLLLLFCIVIWVLFIDGILLQDCLPIIGAESWRPTTTPASIRQFVRASIERCDKCSQEHAQVRGGHEQQWDAKQTIGHCEYAACVRFRRRTFVS